LCKKLSPKLFIENVPATSLGFIVMSGIYMALLYDASCPAIEIGSSKGLKKVDFSNPTPENGKRFSFRNVVVPRIWNSGRRPKSGNPAILSENGDVFANCGNILRRRKN
jgi:hypothetical protein